MKANESLMRYLFLEGSFINVLSEYLTEVTINKIRSVNSKTASFFNKISVVWPEGCGMN